MDLDLARAMRAASVKARETYANDALNPYVVALRIRSAALQGALSVQVSQEKPVDLSDTLAAQALVTLLNNLQYEADWVEVKRFEPAPRGQPGRETLYRELVVSWHRRALTLPDKEQ